VRSYDRWQQARLSSLTHTRAESTTGLGFVHLRCGHGAEADGVFWCGTADCSKIRMQTSDCIHRATVPRPPKAALPIRRKRRPRGPCPCRDSRTAAHRYPLLTTHRYLHTATLTWGGRLTTSHLTHCRVDTHRPRCGIVHAVRSVHLPWACPCALHRTEEGWTTKCAESHREAARCGPPATPVHPRTAEPAACDSP
jgi:hypothetical protein